MNKEKKLLRKIITIVLVIALVILPLLSIATYESVFGRRYDSDPGYIVDSFPGLNSTGYDITSDKGQILKGYHYYMDDVTPKGVVIMAHGIGGGHRNYLDLADHLVLNGYTVFSYDATGNDESEGDSMKGLSQGLIDLDNVISFVEGLPEFSGLPILLFGHSWGGYCVSAVLQYHPEVTAVCEVSGFNETTDLFRSTGLNMVGPVIYAMMPYVALYDHLKFGDVASNTAMDGFAASDCRVMIVHSADDDTVPIRYGYDIFYEEYKDDPRFTFVRYEDLGHNGFLYEENRDEFHKVVVFFDEALGVA